MGFIQLLLCLGLVSGSARAAEWKASLNGETEVEGVHWSSKGVPDTKQNRFIFTQRLPGTVRYGRALRFRFQPLVQADPGNASRTERFYWDFPEAYFQWQALPWTVQVGMNVYNWGDTDVFNPLDVVNARRYFDPFRSEKRGAPAISVKKDFEKFFVEGIYLPVQRKTLLPGENSRWLPRDVYRSRSFDVQQGLQAKILLPSVVTYHYMAADERENALQNNFGARVKFRFSGFDWTLAAFEGAAVTPAVNLRDLPILQVTAVADGVVTFSPESSDIFIQPVYYRNRVGGTSFTLVAGDFLVKGASAYSSPKKKQSDLPAKSWENVLGLERTFSIGSGSLTALAQGTYVQRSDRLDTNTVSLARMFDRAGMGALRWSPNEQVTVLGSYLRDIHFKGNLVHSELSVKVADGWKAKASGDYLSGATETPLGTYKMNKRATISLNSQW